MVRRLILATAIGVVLTGLLWNWSAGPNDEDPDNSPPVVDELVAVSPIETPAPSFEVTSGPVAAELVPTLRDPVTALWNGRVLAPDGTPVAGAKVTWTSLRSEFFDFGVGWDLQDWAAIRAASLETLSAADGRFELPGSLSEVDGASSAIWVTARGYSARWLELKSNEDRTKSVGDVTLERAAAVRVRVVDGAGDPVTGAVVEQLVPIPTGWQYALHTPQAERVFRRQWTTDGDGLVYGVRFPKRVLFRAWHAGQASAPWIGSPRDEVLLTLEPTFTALGHVSVSPQLNLTGPLRVRCFLQNGSQEWPLATVKVGPRSDWGPVTLPLEQADGYRFRLERNKVRVVEVLIAPPQPGESVQVDMAAALGNELWILVEDPEGEPLYDARVTARWDADGVPTTAERRARESDGYVWFGNLPAGVVNILAECPGYAPFYAGPFLLPEAEPATHVITPSRSGRVTGRVEAGENLVEDFEIVVWSAGLPTYLPEGETFRGQADGRFVLEDVPNGTVELVAMAPGFAPGAVVQMESGNGEEVVLQVEPLLRGRGRVVEAQSGEPIDSAVIQLFSMHHQLAVAPSGPPRAVGPDGRFDLIGFAPGNSRMRVMAPGYSTRWVQTNAGAGECIEYGLIAMTGRQTLTIELVWDGEFDPTTQEFSATGAEPLPLTYFPADGILRLDDVSAGIYRMQVRNKQGGEDDLQRTTVICEPGADWHYKFPIAGDRTLIVEVVPERGAEPLMGLVVNAEFDVEGTRSVAVRRRVDGDMRARFEGMPIGPFALRINSGSRDVAVKAGEIRPGERETLIRVQLGESEQTIRVVDSEGDPVAGAWVGLVERGFTTHGQGGFSDGSGELSLILSPGDYVGAAAHPNRGQRYDIPIHIEGRADEVIELVLDAERHVTVKLSAGAVPAAGFPCRLYDLGGFNTVPLVTSDSLGLARWDKFAEGDYLLRINEPGYWPVEVKVPARADEGATVVPVYALGDLRVRLVSASGSALGGSQVVLTPRFLNTSVGDWLAEARVESSSGSMATDAGGLLFLYRLPSGMYEWSVGQASGRVTVPAGDMGDLRVDFP